MTPAPNLSAFPEAAAADFGVEHVLVECSSVETAAGHPRPAKRLPLPDLLAVVLDDQPSVPIAAYFLAEFDSDTGEPYPNHEAILGRDFFLGVREVAFRQDAELVVLRT